MTFNRTLRSLLVLSAFGLVGSVWGAANVAADEPPSAQEIHDRLLGHDSAPDTSNEQPPSTQTPPSQPDCSTEQAVEDNPACYNQVTGGTRSFSLIKPGSGNSGQQPPPPRPS